VSVGTRFSGVVDMDFDCWDVATEIGNWESVSLLCTSFGMGLCAVTANACSTQMSTLSCALGHSMECCPDSTHVHMNPELFQQPCSFARTIKLLRNKCYKINQLNTIQCGRRFRQVQAMCEKLGTGRHRSYAKQIRRCFNHRLARRGICVRGDP
jgi:hypothetical protein